MKNAKSRLACGTYILALLLGLVATPSARGQTYKVLYNFTGGTDGRGPDAGLIEDSAGNLYGTTQTGGASGFGTVFKLDRTGKETVLYSFTGGNDGSEPEASLVRDPAGNLYGTTVIGGADGQGTVFKLDTTGTETVLHSFAGGSDGGVPLAGLVRDPTGNLYGTTSEGGGSSSLCNGENLGCGIVFKVDSAGKETVLYSFTGSADGGFPLAGLIPDSAGNLYGTADLGGSTFDGTVFKVDKTAKETVLYSFAGGTDGRAPSAPLIRDSAGNFYGTTGGGGGSLVCSSGCGTVFKLDTVDTETVLYRFTGGTDGRFPLAGLVRDSAGNLYGTTEEGGQASGFGCGTVFKVEPTGIETVLYSFTCGLDGAAPRAGLVRDKAGNLYGTAGGGASGFGVVFQLKP